MRRVRVGLAAVVSLLFVMLFAGRAVAQVEPADVVKWYMSAGPALYDFEGDEPLSDTYGIQFHVGYDYNEWWTIDSSLLLFASLDENTYGQTTPGTNGSPDVFEIRRPLFEETGEDSVSGACLAVDALFHFTPWKRVDPYLKGGVGLNYYSEDFGAGTLSPMARAGAGMMYHFNDEWAVRADWQSFFVGDDTEANSAIEAGVVWYWGAHVPFKPVGTGGPKDSDADGLFDDEERTIGTNPFDPDTDKDGLEDGAEVHTHKTNPLNPDTDSDDLLDGLEVYKYTTDPLVRDTDDGGVADGHEVNEDGTDPLNGADDLILFELYIQFDYDKAIIKPQYFRQLDVIAKVLKRHPGSTASIEGHTDRTKKSQAKYNKDLSDRRAKSVLSYLNEKQGIAKDRLSAEGFGFEKPKVQPLDMVNGNPENRRVEVYIRGAGKKQDLIDSGLVKESDFVGNPEGDVVPESK